MRITFAIYFPEFVELVPRGVQCKEGSRSLYLCGPRGRPRSGLFEWLFFERDPRPRLCASARSRKDGDVWREENKGADVEWISPDFLSDKNLTVDRERNI